LKSGKGGKGGTVKRKQAIAIAPRKPARRAREVPKRKSRAKSKKLSGVAA
jgi:hypothetical protein